MKRITWMTSALGLVVLLVASGCGGGGRTIGSNNNGGGTGNTANSVALSVGAGPADLTNPAGGYANILFTTITICQPGKSNCTSIDHVLVDTGSSGLRILASELPSGFSLTSETSGSSTLYECLPFLDSYAWGNVVTADVELAGEKGSSVPVQLITTSSAPSTCSGTVATSGSPQVSTVNDLGAKGILGVGNFGADCGTYCNTVQKFDIYFACTSSSASSCSQAGVPDAQQVVNPVQTFSSDNNGVVIQLASVANGGVASANGTMYFGIGTQSDNTPPAGLTVVALDGYGNFVSKFQSTTYPKSFTDTGSNAYFFGTVTNKTSLTTSTGIKACNLGTSANPAYFYCPSSELSESATIASSATPSATKDISFSIGNANTLSGYALSDIAGTNDSDATAFDWGLPFFYGRTVYVGLEGASSSLGSGMYVAF
jgi:hypothetical protein